MSASRSTRRKADEGDPFADTPRVRFLGSVFVGHEAAKQRGELTEAQFPGFTAEEIAAQLVERGLLKREAKAEVRTRHPPCPPVAPLRRAPGRKLSIALRVPAPRAAQFQLWIEDEARKWGKGGCGVYDTTGVNTNKKSFRYKFDMRTSTPAQLAAWERCLAEYPMQPATQHDASEAQPAPAAADDDAQARARRTHVSPPTRALSPAPRASAASRRCRHC